MPAKAAKRPTALEPTVVDEAIRVPLGDVDLLIGGASDSAPCRNFVKLRSTGWRDVDPARVEEIFNAILSEGLYGKHVLTKPSLRTFIAARDRC